MPSSSRSTSPLKADVRARGQHVRHGPTGDANLLRRRHAPDARLSERAAPQGKRLVAKKHLHHHVTRIAVIKRAFAAIITGWLRGPLCPSKRTSPAADAISASDQKQTAGAPSPISAIGHELAPRLLGHIR